MQQKKLLNATNGKQYDAELKNKNLEIKISEVKKLVIKNFDTTNNAFSIKVVNAPNSQPKITKNLGNTALKAKPASDFKLANDLSGFKLNFSKLPFGFNQDFNFQDLSAKYDLSPLFNKLAPQLKVSADQLPSLLWLNIEKFGTPTFSLKFDTQKILDLGGVNLTSLDLGAQSSIGGILTSIADFSDDFLYGKLDLSKDVGSQIAFNYVFHNGETAKIGYSQFSGDASKQLESIGVKFDKDAIISVQKNDGSPLSFIGDTVNYFSDQLNSFFRVNDLLRITSETSAGMVKYINDIVSPAAKLMADILGNDANFNNSFTQLAQMLMQGKSVDEAVSYLAQNTLLDASVKYALKQSGLDSLVASVQIPGVNFVNVIADLVSKGADSAEDLVKKSMVAGVNYIVSNACYSAGATLGNSILPGIGGVIGGAIGSAVASVLMIPIANLIGDAVNAVGELLAKTSQHLVELNIGAIINDAIKFVGQIFEAIGKCIGAIVKAIGDFLGLSDAPEPMQWLSFQAKNDGSNGDYIVVANPSGGYSVVARDGFKDDLVGSNQTNDSLIGSNEANNLFGRNGDDFLDGRSGDDILVGGSGADVLVGGEGSDVLLGDEVRSVDNVGDSFNDFIDGGAGDDKISAGFGDDFVLAGTGNDIIQGEEGDDVILGGAGNDTISGDLGNDMILGGAGNDIIKGGEGDDVILGGEGDDFIAGDAGNDLLFGGAGNDYLLGGDGNDVLISSAGNDVLNGGAGNDEFYITKNVGSITTIADFNPLYDKINLSDFRIKNPEQITYEQVGDDLHLDLGDGQELVLKGISDELISIDNFIFNNSRKDQVAYMSALDQTYGALDEKINNINQSQSYNYNQAHFDAVYVPTYFLGIRIGQKIDRFDYHYEGNFADWNAQNSKFIGNYGNDSVYGNDGNDALYGNAGDDYIDGGSGDDYLQGSGGIDNLNGGAGNDVIFTGNGEDLLFGGDGDDYMDGGIGNDIIDGGSGNNAIFAGNGNDLVRVESGSSRIVAGGGDDIIMVRSLANDETQVWAGVGNDQITASAGNDQIFGEEGDDVIDAGNGYNLIMGGTGNDKITSGFDGAEIDGGAGDDSITSLGSNNHINGGAGHDKIFVGNRFSYLNSANNIFLNEINDDFGDNYVEVNYGKATITLGDGNDGVLTSLGDDEIDAGNGDNYVNAGSGNNTVFIGDGNDTIITGAGDDMIYGGAGDDSIDAGNGNNQIYLGNGNKIVKTGDNNDIVSTGSGNDQIRTGGGVDEIYAGAGNDYIFIDSTSGEIYGQGGSDTYFVNNLDGDIKIIEGEVNNLEFFDSELVVDPNLLDASISHTQINTIGFQAKQLSYLRLAQNGNDLTISFSNKSGKITIVNQFQNANQPQIASLKFGDAIINLTSFIAGTAGNDVINGTINSDTVIGDLGKDLIFGNDGNDFIDGGAGDDVIFGDAGNDVLKGSEDDDIIFGGTGNDRLIGNEGNDVLEGGAGNDLFVLTKPAGNDTITDFKIDEDKIDTLSYGNGNGRFSTLKTLTYFSKSIEQIGSDVKISFDNNTSLTIQNQTTSNLLQNQNFIFDLKSVYANYYVTYNYWGMSISKLVHGLSSFGTDGNDILAGSNYLGIAFNDKIIDGKGSDLMFGDTGIDTFILTKNAEDIDTIADFDVSQEIIDLRDFTDNVHFSQLKISQKNNDTIISLFDNRKILLENVVASQVSAKNFKFFNYEGMDPVQRYSGKVDYDFMKDQGVIIKTTATSSTTNLTIAPATVVGSSIDLAKFENNVKSNAGSGYSQSNFYADGGNDSGSQYYFGGTYNMLTNPAFFIWRSSVFNGTNGNDKMYAGSWGESIYAGGGNDMVDGGRGIEMDWIFGEAGNDTLFGRGGEDYIYGGDGNDYIDGGIGNDLALNGDDGSDYIRDGFGNNVINGGRGNDRIEAGFSGGYLSFEEMQDLQLTFDADFYLKTYPDVAQHPYYGSRPLQHFIDYGQYDGRVHNKYFDAVNYLKKYPDVANNAYYRDKPLKHFLDWGISEGRSCDEAIIRQKLEENSKVNYIDGRNGNYVNGQSGDDLITLGKGHDSIYGGRGNDYIDAGAGDDYINSGYRVELTDSAEFDSYSSFKTFNAFNYNSGWTSQNSNQRLLADVNGDGKADIVGFGYSCVYVCLANGNGSFNSSIAATDLFSFSQVGYYNNYIREVADINGDGRADIFAFGGPTSYIAITDSKTDNDVVHAGDGNDTLVDNFGNNLIYLENGNDTANLGAGNDYIDGGAGDDRIDAGGGNDFIVAGSGNDYVLAGDGNDTIQGISGLNWLHGGAGDDRIEGGIDADTIYGGLNNDTILGNDGSDLIDSGNGDDLVYGGNGDDKINLGFDNDTAYGDAGNDYIEGGFGNDSIYGNAGNDMIYGNEGEDKLYGEDGSDYIIGGAGNDYINTGSGMNVVDGGAGDDVIIGGTGDDILVGGKGSDIITGGLGSDIFKFNFIEESYSNLSKSEVDLIIDFAIGEDKIDLSTIDTINDFNALTITYDATSNTTKIDYASSDFAVKFSGNIALSESDFIF